MPRLPRSDHADTVYHLINRANARAMIFDTHRDYGAFEDILADAKEKTHMRVYAFVIMPNHWHLLVEPRADGDLGRFMKWLTLTHTMRWHAVHDSVGRGHIYQGRYKSFPVQSDEYFLTVCRYIERNPVRAGLVQKPTDWQWGSAWRRSENKDETLLDEWTTPKPDSYDEWLNTSEEKSSLDSIRTSVNRGRPFGQNSWVSDMARTWNLGSSLHARGRPRK